jgi:hypothetical protein
MHRGGRRAVEGIVTGTAFFSSTILLAKAIVIHQLALRDYFMFVGYHVATAYYVESRLAFRDVKPHVAPCVWIPAVALTAPLWPAAPAAEPTYKFAANIKRYIKYSRYQDIARMGRRELARGAIFTALLAVFYYI